MKNNLLHTPEGVRDIYSVEYERKLALQETLHRQLKLYGFSDIQTPTFEFFDIFSNNIGITPSNELYKFFDKEGNTLVLRPDFTPSIARATAKYFMEEKMPVRFCYMGNTFINKSDLQGYLKETTQIGAELIGDSSVEADAEMISLMISTMKATGLKDFQITIGNVEFFKGLCTEYRIDDQAELSLREFISNKNYFGAQDILDSLTIEDNVAEIILKTEELFGNIESMTAAKKLVSNSRSINAINRLEKLYELLCIYGIEQYVSFDLGMLSKYNYYTGIIFRAYTYGTGDAIIKGGRYDDLLNEFGKDSASIGFTVTVDQLLSALQRQGIEPEIAELSRTLVIYTKEVVTTAIRHAEKLRNDGIDTELIMIREDQKIDDFLSYAERNRIKNIISISNEGMAEIRNVRCAE